MAVAAGAEGGGSPAKAHGSSSSSSSSAAAGFSTLFVYAVDEVVGAVAAGPPLELKGLSLPELAALLPFARLGLKVA